jgi:hypothetical protein
LFSVPLEVDEELADYAEALLFLGYCGARGYSA